MSDRTMTVAPQEATAAPSARVRRRDRHAAGRRALARRGLAAVAGIGLAAAALALLAVPDAGRTPPISLPDGAAANAAFTAGLRAAPIMATPVASQSSSAKSVVIQNYAFAPATLTIAAGTTVTWTNMDTAPHTVTVSSGPVLFSSPTLQKGYSYTYTFTTPGTYSYYCAVHPQMTAKVVVTGGASTGTPTPTPSSSAPATTGSSSMPMPQPNPQTCAVSTALQVFLTHVNTAHLDESPGQQVSDILNVDQYVGNHLALVQRMFEPLTGGGLTSALSSLLSTLLTHVNTAHLDEAPAQQVNDILNVNSYIGNHLALVQHMLAGTEALAC